MDAMKKLIKDIKTARTKMAKIRDAGSDMGIHFDGTVDLAVSALEDAIEVVNEHCHDGAILPKGHEQFIAAEPVPTAPERDKKDALPAVPQEKKQGNTATKDKDKKKDEKNKDRKKRRSKKKASKDAVKGRKSRLENQAEKDAEDYPNRRPFPNLDMSERNIGIEGIRWENPLAIWFLVDLDSGEKFYLRATYRKNRLQKGMYRVTEKGTTFPKAIHVIPDKWDAEKPPTHHVDEIEFADSDKDIIADIGKVIPE